MADLQREVHEIGYQLGPYTSKDTLGNIKRLHSLVLTEKNINVAELNDLELRKNLTEHGLLVGPVTNHTRAIYQRKLLEVLTNQTTEEGKYETDENTFYPNLSDKNSFSYGLRSTYDGPMILRNDYKAASRDTLTRNNYDSNIVRPRILTKTNELQPIKINNDNDKIQVTTTNNGTMFYASLTIIVALIVFILYLWLA